MSPLVSLAPAPHQMPRPFRRSTEACSVPHASLFASRDLRCVVLVREEKLKSACRRAAPPLHAPPHACKSYKLVNTCSCAIDSGL